MVDMYQALDWWDNYIQNTKDRVEWKFRLCYKYFEGRNYPSLTDSEIEFIWYSETKLKS